MQLVESIERLMKGLRKVKRNEERKPQKSRGLLFVVEKPRPFLQRPVKENLLSEKPP
jgi:hypothetical protein